LSESVIGRGLLNGCANQVKLVKRSTAEWSSSWHYVLAEPGIVLVEDKQKAEMKVRQIA
jgi:hypothetical protein